MGKGKDLLLFQLSSPVIDGTGGLKPAGIWAGMSGSPVYSSDGALIGAVSYSLNYDNLPVAGVTPAEYMKTIGSTLADAPVTVRVGKQNLNRAEGRTTAAQTAALPHKNTLRSSTPCSFPGVTPTCLCTAPPPSDPGRRTGLSPRRRHPG